MATTLDKAPLTKEEKRKNAVFIYAQNIHPQICSAIVISYQGDLKNVNSAEEGRALRKKLSTLAMKLSIDMAEEFNDGWVRERGRFKAPE